MQIFKEIRNLLVIKMEELNKLQSMTEKSIKRAPEGTLVLSECRGTVQYYHKTNCNQKKGKYISKKNEKLIKELAQKDYDSNFWQEIEKEKRNISKILGLLPKKELTETYERLSERRKELVEPHVLTDEQYAEQWTNSQYMEKTFLDNMPVLITERGERVRSKSEKIIADKLYSMGIPYKYECPLKLRGYGTVYPDFTILNIQSRQEIYLEHFGIMDNPQYASKAIIKLESYLKNGIHLGKNLLITFETYQRPLDTRLLEQMLKEFVLS